jgi:hypothetical protein
MNDANFKPSLHVDKFVPEDYALDTERFLVFLRAYYEWLQTTKITLTGISGTFVRNETVTASGGGVGVIKEVGTGYIILQMTSRLSFNRAETITGGTSNATATIRTIKDNVVRASGNISNYRNAELSIDNYVSYLREELYPSIPAEYYGDRRLLATKLKQFFESKSNEESYRFIFKLLYNEDVEFYYPGEDILRVSDGNFERAQIIRVQASSNSFNFVNKTIVGQTSEAIANVVDVKVLFIGSIQVAEMTLSLVSGTFQGGETIADLNDSTLTATLYGMITGFTINDGGSGYRANDVIPVTGDGSAVEVVVGSVKETPISAIQVNQIGHGYRLNTNAIIDNSGTGGTGLAIRVTGLANTYSYTDANTSTTYTLGEISKVQILNRGSGYVSSPSITLQDVTIASLGLLSPELITINDGGIDYGVGNTLVFTGGSGANAAGQVASVEESTSYDFLFEDGMRMLSEDSYYDIIKNEDWDVLGPIARIEFTNFGDGYESANLPSISITTTTGSGANVVVTNIQGKSANVTVDAENNIAGIGTIRSLTIRDFGVNYTSATADATGEGDGNANLTPIISGIGVKEGFWIDDDGKLDYKFIQDSLFYQDFSYVIKSGLAFSTYATAVKKIIHPAGLQFFGEILIASVLDVSPTILSSDILSEIQQYVIYIESFFSMGIVDSSSVILREIQIEKEINLSSNLLSEKEYTVILPPVSQNVESLEPLGEYNLEILTEFDDQVSTDVLTTLFLPPETLGLDFLTVSSKISRNVQTEFNVGFQSIEKVYEIEVNLGDSSAVSIEMEILSSGNQSEIIQYMVSYVNAFPAYGITYGDLQIRGRGVYDEDWSNTPISDLQNFRFNEFYQTFTSTQLPVTIQRSTLSDINTVIETITFEVKTKETVTAEISTQSKIPKISNRIVPIPAMLTVQTEMNKFIQNNLNATSSLETILYNVEIENVIENQFSIDMPVYRIVESFNDSNTLFLDETINKYKEILGTVSFNAGGQYKDLQILGFANVIVGAVSSSTFETAIPLVTGNGTFFLTDYSVGNVFVANDEYFVITNIFSNTNMTIDRPPESTFTDVVAYKII